MVLGKLPVPGRHSRARAYCACCRCGWGLFGDFYSYLSFLSSFSLSLGDGPIWTEILSQRVVKLQTNQPTKSIVTYNIHSKVRKMTTIRDSFRAKQCAALTI